QSAPGGAGTGGAAASAPQDAIRENRSDRAQIFRRSSAIAIPFEELSTLDARVSDFLQREVDRHVHERRVQLQLRARKLARVIERRRPGAEVESERKRHLLACDLAVLDRDRS